MSPFLWRMFLFHMRTLVFSPVAGQDNGLPSPDAGCRWRRRGRREQTSGWHCGLCHRHPQSVRVYSTGLDRCGGEPCIRHSSLNRMNNTLHTSCYALEWRLTCQERSSPTQSSRRCSPDNRQRSEVQTSPHSSDVPPQVTWW